MSWKVFWEDVYINIERVKIDTGSAQIKLRKELSKHLVAKAIMMEEKTKKNSLIN